MNRIYTGLCIFFFLFLLLYSCIHTWEVDEAWTFVSVQHESIFDLLLYKHFYIANNHLLNSLWFRCMQSLGFHKVLFYRLGSLLSFPFYCFFLYRAVTYKAAFWQKRSDWWMVLFFLPPIMVYFSLGRGYGMATMFFVGSLYYMKRFLEEKRSGDYWRFFALGAFSCLAIVSFLFPFIAMLGYVLLQTRQQLFAKRNFIAAALLLPLAAYIYYIGKTIILHDKIINGTDNLFVNGMYSTFIGALGVYQFVFPCQELLLKLNLVMVSKALVLVTLIPLIVIIVGKYRSKYRELIVLLIMTLLFLAAHLIVKAKYPSDRSVIYAFYLMYIPVVLHIVEYRDKFFKLHYFVVLLWSAVNGFSFVYELTRPSLYHYLEAQPAEKQYTIVSDWPNFGDDVYNQLYFDGRMHFSYVAKSFEDNWDRADQQLKVAVADPTTDIILLQPSTYERNKALFASGYTTRTVISSGSKELILIHH